MNTGWTFGRTYPSLLQTLGGAVLKHKQPRRIVVLCSWHTKAGRCKSSSFPWLLPFIRTFFLFFRNLFYILLVQQNSPPQRKKAKLFLDKSVICLPQNGKFNHTNDCTNGCGGWFFTSRMMSLRMRRSSAAVVHCPEARRTALPWTNPARL